MAKCARQSTPAPPVDLNLNVNAKTYWATVYTITGEKVATAFVANDGEDSVIFARPITKPEAVVCAPDKRDSDPVSDANPSEI